MCECLEPFSAPTREWFRHAFGAPTEAQREAWPAIASGRDVLVIAPTGSGKTLAAFLSAIDRLMAAPTGAPGGGEDARSARRRGVSVLYVSPLKALAVDVARNLEAPLEGIAAQCGAMGLPAPSIRVATRSGDTTPKERRAIASHPPDILVTTPESLYLMLTSKARRVLKTVDTVIIDEIHALAGTKRGAHLALSLERLDDLIAGGDATGRRAQRIGLSATVNPPAEAARFLGGARPVDVVDSGSRPAMSLKVVEPLADMHDLQSANAPHRAGGVDADGRAAPHISGVTPAMRRLAERRGLVPDGDADGSAGSGTATDSRAVVGAVGDGSSGSIWPVIERSVLDEILAHRTTLVFVNSRGLAEKLTARLNDLYAQGRGAGGAGGADEPSSPEGREGFAAHYDAVVGGTTQLVGSHAGGDVIAMAHHGSVSKDRRKQIEERLKRGELRCVVATSSLELGIDMGSVDLVIQISPPLSVASGLQRVGRADHRVGGVSHALLYPLTREQIAGVAASVECMRAGDIEPLAMPSNPLDILAQQTVAAAAMEDLDPDRWFGTVRRAAPFAALGRDMFDAVLGMLAGAYDTEEFSAFRPPLMWNHEADRISARPGAQRLAVTSGGTIPDRGLYTVVLPEADAGKGRRRVGELDEEMVYESRVGDIITLGTSTWRIQEITRDQVVVTPAPGRTARLPFWHGEGAGRDAGFGRAKGRFLREAAAGLIGDGGRDPAFTPAVLRRLRDDGLDGNSIANLARLLAEQRAATGVVPCDTTLVVERCPDEEGDLRVIIHSPYGRRVHEPWSMAITARMRQRYGFDGQAYAADDGIVIRIPQGVGDISIRGLLLFEPDDLRRLIETQVEQSVLYAAKFRECAARSLYLPRTEPGRRVPLWQQRLRAAQLLAAARTRRNFPLLLETARECLQDVYDLDALRELMDGLRGGTIAMADAETSTPSPLAENLLFGFVGSVMYQYDVPQAERSAGILSMDPQVLERLLGDTDMSAVLDPDAIAQVSRELGERTFWNELAADDVEGRVARYAKTHGPFAAGRMIADLGIDATAAVRALDMLKARGELLEGRFVGDADDGGHASGDGEGMGVAAAPSQWLHRDVFRRIRALSLAKAREAVKPVAPAAYQSFLLERQGVGPVGGERHEGTDGLMRVIEQLEGVALPAGIWESAVFPARVAGYTPAMLDELLAGGEAVWIGSKTGPTDAREPGRIAFHPADSPLLACDEGDVGRKATGEGTPRPDPYAAAILASLSSGGAYHATQLAESVRRSWNAVAEPDIDPATGEIVLPQWGAERFETALWSLVWQGKVTNSSFAPVRALGAGMRTVRAPVRASRRRVRMRAAAPMTLGGLWSAVRPEGGVPPTGDELLGAERRALEQVEILLDRYGVVAQPLVDKEDLTGGFSTLYPVLKRMEERGRLVRGMFVRGFGAAQFADRDTVDALRHADGADDGHMRSPAVLSVLDPANLYGTAVPWPSTPGGAARPACREGGVVTFCDGVPVAFATPRSGRLTVFAFDAADDAVGDAANGSQAQAQAEESKERRPKGTDARLRLCLTELAAVLRRPGPGTVTFRDVNGTPLDARNPYARVLHQAGFTPVPQGMRLY